MAKQQHNRRVRQSDNINSYNYYNIIIQKTPSSQINKLKLNTF